MFRDMHLTRNKQLGRLHERLSRELNRQLMDENDRRLEALKANDFEAYKELLKQTYGPLSTDDRFAGARK
jgi:SWI/SNF-related matrix-associated actin-dependent regulator of chromatin subfamily A protein 2/4